MLCFLGSEWISETKSRNRNAWWDTGLSCETMQEGVATPQSSVSSSCYAKRLLQVGVAVMLYVF